MIGFGARRDAAREGSPRRPSSRGGRNGRDGTAAGPTFWNKGIRMKLRSAMILSIFAVLAAVSATEAPGAGELPPGRMVGQRLTNFTLVDAVSGKKVSLY